jgi:ABC-2 type transport system permease protein
VIRRSGVSEPQQAGTPEPQGAGASVTKPVAFAGQVALIAGRALRQASRDPASLLPAVFVPAFFYAVNLGALERLARSGLDYKAFLLPMAVAFAVTGMSRAPSLVADIQGGYFDRLCLTPVRRGALLLGMMVADVVIIVMLCVPVLGIGYGVGVRFATGIPGVLAFVGFSALWGLAFTGFPYAVALRTGSAAAVNACFVVFFPLFFLTDAVVPKALLTGWFSAIATVNPVTYLLGALRSLNDGWQVRPLIEGSIAVAGLTMLGMGAAWSGLRARVRMSR